jgi:hypothetical protein
VCRVNSYNNNNNSKISSHHNAQGLSLLARCFLKYQAIFFLALLDHVFLSVDNIKFVWEVFLMASTVDIPASFSCFPVSVSPTSHSYLLLYFVATFLFPWNITCYTLYNPHLCCFQPSFVYSKSACFTATRQAWQCPRFYRILTVYLSLFRVRNFFLLFQILYNVKSREWGSVPLRETRLANYGKGQTYN